MSVINMTNYTLCKKCGLWITFHERADGVLGIFNMDTRYYHGKTCKARRRMFRVAAEIRAEYDRANDPNKRKILRLKRRTTSG